WRRPMPAPDPTQPASPGRRRFLLNGVTLAAALAAGGLATGGLAGCAGGRDQPGGSGGSGGSSRGGALRVATPDGVPADYFIGTSFSQPLQSMFHMAWPLYHASATDFEMANALAAGYRAAPDGLAHTITLRKDLVFHDGSPIDGEAVAENLRSYFFEDHPLR